MDPEESEALEAKRDRNRERRREFVRRWAEYVRTHPDEEWSRQANVVVDAQISAPEDGDKDED